MGRKIEIGALISGGGSNLQAIMDACEDGRIEGRVSFVGSDNPDAKGLERAGKKDIPVFTVDYDEIIAEGKKRPGAIEAPADFDFREICSKQTIFAPDAAPRKVRLFLETRAAAESRLLEHMAEYPFDLLVLAGFMRILTPYFIDRVNTDPEKPRIMNIHPALLPSFPGTDGYGDTFRYGCKVGGCTVHFVDYGEDSGPIIGQKAFEILPEDTIDDVRKRGLRLEWELYPECVRLFGQGRLRVAGNISDSGKNGGRKSRPVVEIKSR